MVSKALLEKGIRKIKADELELMEAVFGNQNQVAQILGVSRSRVSKWHKGENPDGINNEKLSGLNYLLTILLNHYLPQTAIKWLNANNVFIGGARPIDLIKGNDLDRVISAAKQDIAGSYA
jgi:transcriptional regulator with XRE-family HTH domain